MIKATTVSLLCILISLNESIAQTDTLSVAGNEWTLVADIPGQNMPMINLTDGAVYNISVEGPGLKTKFVQPDPFRYIVLWEGSTNAHYFVRANNPITITFTGDAMYAFLVDVNNIDSSGELDIIFGTMTSVEEGYGGIPMEFELNQNYPNPFNPSTTITYALPEAAEVSLIIYNLRGESVANLVNERQSAGWHNIKWQASNLSTGIYFYKLIAGGFVQTKKMILLK